jgi:hypothetical protein
MGSWRGGRVVVETDETPHPRCLPKRRLEVVENKEKWCAENAKETK